MPALIPAPIPGRPLFVLYEGGPRSGTTECIHEVASTVSRRSRIVQPELKARQQAGCAPAREGLL